MTKCYVVVEGETDAAILSQLLADQLSSGQVEIKTGRGRSSAVSLARTMLVSRSASTALVLDADSTNEERIREMEAELEGSLADVARRERFGLFLVVPSIETCLFQDIDGLRDYFGSDFSMEQMVQSRYDPKSVLQTRLEECGQQYNVPTLRAIIEKLDIQRLCSLDVIRDLLQFLVRAREATPV